jgi:hypothetical protein
VKQDDLVAVGDPGAAEAHPHASAQRFGIQQSLGQRITDEEVADRSRREGTLLPG